MTYAEPSREAQYKLMDEARTIAMVGASSNQERDSYHIFGRLLKVGYHVIPVNPRETVVLGQKAYRRSRRSRRRSISSTSSGKRKRLPRSPEAP